VSHVAAAMGLPSGRYGSNGAYAVEGRHTFGPGQTLPEAGFRLATPGYFPAMGIPIRRGRDFANTDRYEAPFVAIVSESLARETFPNEDPIGKRIQCGLDSMNFMTIVGVVGDVRQASPAAKPGPELYMPVDQHPYFANELQVVVRTAVPPESLTAPVEAAVRRAGPGIAVKFTTLETMVSDSIAASRLRTWLASAFAVLAIVLAMAGVYGVMSYSVAQRMGEMGVRIAMGATPGDVMRLILGRALMLTGTGIAVGAALSFGAGRFVEGMLFEVTANNPATHAAVWLAVGLTAIAAAAIPAWRASRVDPLVALREE
jgi:putative ABC transport system permease protein